MKLGTWDLKLGTWDLKNITIISFLLLMIIILFIDRRLFQTEILRLTETIDSFEKSNTALKNTVAEQNRRIKAIQDILQKNKVGHTDNFRTTLFLYGIFSALAVLPAIIIFLLILKKKLSSATDILGEKIHKIENTLVSQIIKSEAELTGFLGTPGHVPHSEFSLLRQITHCLSESVRRFIGCVKEQKICRNMQKA